MAYDKTKALKLGHGELIAQKTHGITAGLQTQINNLSTDVIKAVKVNGTALTATNNAVDVLITVEKKATADTGYAASYQVKANGVAVGDTINVAKDWLLTSVTKGTVTAEDKAAGGKFENDTDFAVGDRYADLEFNVKAGGAETSTHLYVNLQEFVDIYTAGDGLQDSSGTWSIKINSSDANGLAVDSSGLALGLATDSVAGAMGATEHAKLSGISTEANKTTVTTEKAGTIEIDGTSKVIVEFATDNEVNEMLTTVFGA